MMEDVTVKRGGGGGGCCLRFGRRLSGQGHDWTRVTGAGTVVVGGVRGGSEGGEYD